ncbi:MAG: tetratricopeptide repeat protein, partial [Treponemataceae bacterium]
EYFLTYVYRGGLYDQLGEYEKAFEDYKKIVELNPRYYYALESLGQVAWKLEKWVDCMDAYEKIMKINKKNVSYPIIIAAIYKKNGMHFESKEFISKALREFDRSTADYAVLRLFGDGVAEMDVLRKVRTEQNINQRLKLLYFMGLYFEIINSLSIAKELYTEVSVAQYPSFAEFRMNQWSLDALEEK